MHALFVAAREVTEVNRAALLVTTEKCVVLIFHYITHPRALDN